jgi:hypothetical protein
MNDISDQWLVERFAPLRKEGEAVDWRRISRRSRRVRRRAAMLIVAVVAVIVVSAPAFGWHRTIINWLDADEASQKVQIEFAQLGVGAPPEYELGIEHEKARTVASVTHAGKTYVLSVAPTKKGGFCFWWGDVFTSCRQERTPPPDLPEPNPGGLASFRLGSTWMLDAIGVIRSVAGNLIGSDAEQLFAVYADGERVEIPLTWVSEPIDAGFYIHFTPAEHRRVGMHMTALEATTSEGRVVARQTLKLTPVSETEQPARLPDGQMELLPAKAIASKAVKLIDFRASNGHRVTLWEMPSTEGGVCYVHNRGSGCPPRPPDVPMSYGIAGGGAPVLFDASTRPEVAEVVLRFEDGAEKRIRPTEGYVLTEIPPRNYARGHRLIEVVALSASGGVLARRSINPASQGLYPCEQPVDQGFGVMTCP